MSLACHFLSSLFCLPKPANILITPPITHKQNDFTRAPHSVTASKFLRLTLRGLFAAPRTDTIQHCDTFRGLIFSTSLAHVIFHSALHLKYPVTIANRRGYPLDPHHNTALNRLRISSQFRSRIFHAFHPRSHPFPRSIAPKPACNRLVLNPSREQTPNSHCDTAPARFHSIPI